MTRSPTGKGIVLFTCQLCDELLYQPLELYCSCLLHSETWAPFILAFWQQHCQHMQFSLSNAADFFVYFSLNWQTQPILVIFPLF